MSKRALEIDRFNQTFQIPRGAWIVSYADIVTLILTFFILLLSISTISQNKYDLIVQAFTGEKAGTLAEVKEKLDQVVKAQGLAGEVKTNLDIDGLEVSFSNALLFDSGEAELKTGAIEAMKPIQSYLLSHLDDPYGMIVEGYSDDRPISTPKFASNWELSTSRAINVMNELVKSGIDRRRISIQGFAETRSATDVDLTSTQELNQLSDSARDEARSSNRRVVLRINHISPKVLQKIKAKGGWQQVKPISPENSASPENLNLNDLQPVIHPINQDTTREKE